MLSASARAVLPPKISQACSMAFMASNYSIATDSTQAMLQSDASNFHTMDDIEKEAKDLRARFQGMNRAGFARDNAIPGGDAMIYQHITGRRPMSLDAAVAYARAFDVPLSEISQRIADEVRKAGSITGSAAIVLSAQGNLTDAIGIPRLYVAGSMGEGSDYPAEDEVIEKMTLRGDWLRQMVPKSSIGDLRIISGKGHSMAPTFNDGDLMLVDTGVRAVDVDGVYVLSANGRLYIKTVRQRMDGHFEVSSDNPAVKTVDVLNGDYEVQVHGRVVWAWNGRKL